METVLDHPATLPLAGVLLALLGGFGFMRWRSRMNNDSGETSFLESRLQPDSFFGASGGQRIDTRDAGASSSSMSYSLSQLDAIGDVDPVAEADVYLAYGRDLQAEEILKEAMRANPDRLAIRIKLLEVYAKRRDTKGFELLATQIYALTRGDGEDWHRAQELGAELDPENTLYQPGGQPALSSSGGEEFSEPLGATTMPQSVLPSPSQFEALPPVPAPAIDLDLDLDLDTPSTTGAFDAPVTRPAPIETRPMPTAEPMDIFRLDDGFAPPPSAPVTQPADLDLGSLDFDLSPPGASTTPPAPAPAVEPVFDLDTDYGSDEPTDIADPLARKLELADEFRQIGDIEGARDLLKEVVAKAEGSVRARAQGMLDDLP